LYHGKCIRIVVLSRLNQCAGIGVALGHHTRKGSDDLLVSGHRFEPAASRVGNAELLLHGVERGLGSPNLCCRLLVFGSRVIQLLFRDQPWSFFGSFFQTGVLRVHRGVRRLGADDLALCASNIRLAVANLGLRALDLVLQLWDFQKSQDFALTNAVAYIDFDPANISRDFGVKIHLLIGLKLTGNRERTGQIATHDRYDCRRPRLLGRAFAIATSNDQEESCQ
jgi:hypothetical protein